MFWSSQMCSNFWRQLILLSFDLVRKVHIYLSIEDKWNSKWMKSAENSIMYFFLHHLQGKGKNTSESLNNWSSAGFLWLYYDFKARRQEKFRKQKYYRSIVSIFNLQILLFLVHDLSMYAQSFLCHFSENK